MWGFIAEHLKASRIHYRVAEARCPLNSVDNILFNEMSKLTTL